MIHRKWFFDNVRASLGAGQLNQQQVDGFNVILDRADLERLDHRQLAYVLATAWHETAFTMAPIAEYGRGQGYEYGKPDPVTGQCYYGRGFVQLTWEANYAACQEEYGARWGDRDIHANADMALEPDIATDVIFFGMASGLFTGVKLADYINDTVTDWKNARRIVNGLDCADKIASYAASFHGALSHTPGNPGNLTAEAPSSGPA